MDKLLNSYLSWLSDGGDEKEFFRVQRVNTKHQNRLKSARADLNVLPTNKKRKADTSRNNVSGQKEDKKDSGTKGGDSLRKEDGKNNGTALRGSGAVESLDGNGHGNGGEKAASA